MNNQSFQRPINPSYQRSMPQQPNSAFYQSNVAFPPYQQGMNVSSRTYNPQYRNPYNNRPTYPVQPPVSSSRTQAASSDSSKDNKTKKKKKSNVLTTVILVVLLVVGLGIMFYPSISDYFYSLQNTYEIQDYQSVIENMTNSDYQNIIDEAVAYNEALSENQISPTQLSASLKEQYDNELAITSTGIMGYINIPSVNISLPIFHGASADVLQHGAGHLEGTSLPIGGPSTHSVILAHTGLPSAKLFTDIDRLEIGDTFTINIMRETHTYVIDQIKTVLPEEVESLRIVPNQDYITLMTCTPYGINTHRLLVRGHALDTGTNLSTVTDYKVEFLIEGILLPTVAVVVITAIICAVAFVKTSKRTRKDH